MSSTLLVTQAAARKVFELLKEEENFKLNLRVYVTGGGCSGMQYGFAFDEAINADDTVVTKEIDDDDDEEVDEDEDEGEGEGEGSISVKLVVDAVSYQYLMGAQIDYKEDLEGAQFIIRNPNAKTTCGCGSSFSAE